MRQLEMTAKIECFSNRRESSIVKSLEKSTIKLISKNNMVQNSLKNRLVSVIIFAATCLLSFTMIFLCNTYFDMHSISGTTSQVLVVMFTIVLVISIATGVSIRSIVYISAVEKINDYARLKMIGATKEQLKNIITYEKHTLLKRCLPPAVILSIIIGIILPGKFYGISCITIFISVGFIIVLVTGAYEKPVRVLSVVSPIEAVRCTENLRMLRKDKKREFLSPFKLAIKYATSVPKQFIRSILSLTLSGVLMFSIFSVMQSIDVEELASYTFHENSDYILSLNSDLLSEEDNYSYNELMKNSPLTNELFQKIQNMSEVKEIYRLKILDCEIVNENTEEVTDIEGIESIINEKEFANQLIEGTMPQKKAETDTMPIVINLASDAYIDSQLSLQVGDSILAKIDTGNRIQETHLKVSGIINDPNSTNAIYTNEGYLEQITDMNPDVNWYICTGKSDIEQKLYDIVATDNRISLSSKKDTIQQYSDYFYNFTMAIMAFVFIISIFSFLNTFNLCVSNIVERKKEYAMLEAIGMTPKQLKKMQSVECSLYLFSGFIGSCILGIPVGIMLCNKIAELSGIFYIHYKFPVYFLIFYLGFLLIIRLAMTKYQNSIIFKNSIINRIRE